MAGAVRLKKDSDIIDTSPRPGFEAPGERREAITTAYDGTQRITKFYGKNSYTLNLINVSTADYLLIYGWWDDRDIIQFYPDYDTYPSAYVSCRIMNTGNPLVKQWPSWTVYTGTLLLRQV